MVMSIRAMLTRYRNQRGVALLATMLAIALMTLIVVDFTSSSALGYLSAANQANELRAGYLARSAVNVGLAILAQDSRAQQAAQERAGAGNPGLAAPVGQSDSLMSVWAAPFPPLPINGGTASLSIVDEARKFDINRIINGYVGATTANAPGAPEVPAAPATNAPANSPELIPGQPNPRAVAQLRNLIEILGLSPQIIPAIIDWLDRDSIDQPGGAEADYYLRLIPPYEPRNGPMPTIGDLRMIKGIDEATFNKLKNYLTVAPENLINVNTASPEVLAAAFSVVVPEAASNPRILMAILQARIIKPFSNPQELAEVPGLTSLDPNKMAQVLTTKSSYFTISGMGTYAGARRMVNAVFDRTGNGTANLESWQED
jgi:general secretion pathway protein K